MAALQQNGCRVVAGEHDPQPWAVPHTPAAHAFLIVSRSPWPMLSHEMQDRSHTHWPRPRPSPPLPYRLVSRLPSPPLPPARFSISGDGQQDHRRGLLLLLRVAPPDSPRGPCCWAHRGGLKAFRRGSPSGGEAGRGPPTAVPHREWAVLAETPIPQQVRGGHTERPASPLQTILLDGLDRAASPDAFALPLSQGYGCRRPDHALHLTSASGQQKQAALPTCPSGTILDTQPLSSFRWPPLPSACAMSPVSLYHLHPMHPMRVELLLFRRALCPRR